MSLEEQELSPSTETTALLLPQHRVDTNTEESTTCRVPRFLSRGLSDNWDKYVDAVEQRARR